MKRNIYFIAITALVFVFASTLFQLNLAAEGKKMNKKILIAYYSRTGNTREIANQIHKIVGGEIFELVPVTPYPSNYNACVNQAKQELKSGYKAPLKSKIDVKNYDIILIGYPIWWGTFPAPVRTFLNENDFSGKTIAPFCTHGGSGLSRSVSDISNLCPKATLLEGFEVPGSSVGTAQNKVSDWLKRIKIEK